MSEQGKTTVIKLCIGSSCHLRGSNSVSEVIQEYLALNAAQLAAYGNIEFSYDFCMDDCANGVCVTIVEGAKETKLRKVTAQTIAASLDGYFGFEQQ